MRDYAYSTSPRRRNTGRSSRSTSSGQEWIHILLFYFLPFIVINGLLFFLVTSSPKCELTIGETHDYLSAEIQLSVKSFLPTKELTVSMDSEPIEMTKGKGHTYTATVTKNGVLEVYAKSINGMATSAYEHVNILDDNPPAVDNYSMEDGVLKFTLEDSQSGVDFNSIYATDSSGVTVYPSSVDKTTGTITFNVDAGGLTVFISDLSGNQSQTTFTPHSSEGGADEAETTTVQTN